MTGRVLRRFGAALATLVAASILVWIMLMAAPTDPVEGILRARGILEPDPYQVAAMRAELGLDELAVGALPGTRRVVRHRVAEVVGALGDVAEGQQDADQQ